MGLNLTPSAMAYLVLLLAVASLRIFELRVSRRNQAAMAARGAAKLDKPNFRWVVLVHTGVLIGAAAEVLFLRRPFYPALAGVMFALFLASDLKLDKPNFRWVVLVHTGVLIGAAAEVLFLRRPFYPALAGVMFALFLA